MKAWLLAALAMIWATPVIGQQQPYRLAHVEQMIRAGVPDGVILVDAVPNCIDFRLTAEVRQRLAAAGASESLLAALNRVCVRLPRRSVEEAYGNAWDVEVSGGVLAFQIVGSGRTIQLGPQADVSIGPSLITFPRWRISHTAAYCILSCVRSSRWAAQDYGLW
jgi:hypothetical protein